METSPGILRYARWLAEQLKLNAKPEQARLINERLAHFERLGKAAELCPRCLLQDGQNAKLTAIDSDEDDNEIDWFRCTVCKNEVSEPGPFYKPQPDDN
jgi:hypothetical protein